MNDLLAPLLKAAPSYVFFGFLLAWIIFRALPDSAQFFGEFLPHRRRLARTRAVLESIKAKTEAFEIAQKYGIQIQTSLNDVLKLDLEALLEPHKQRLSPRERHPFWTVVIEIIYTIIVSIMVVIVIFGLIFSSQANAKLKWSSELTVMFVIIFFAALVGGYTGWTTSRDSIPKRKRLSLFYFLITPAAAGIGGMTGTLFGGMLVEGVNRLFLSSAN